MFNCLTRNEMKFGDLVIPPFTEGIIITNQDNLTAKAPGVSISVSISEWDCTGIEKELKKINPDHFQYGPNKINIEGLVIRTNTNDVYILYKHSLRDVSLYKWQVEKLIVPITEDSTKPEWMKDRHYLGHIVDCFDDWFSDWVMNNCKFRRCNKADREEHLYLEPGMRILTDEGLSKFYEKQHELMVNLGEATGYIFEFKGGLNWD